jgi:hypothetical protein
MSNACQTNGAEQADFGPSRPTVEIDESPVFSGISRHRPVPSERPQIWLITRRSRVRIPPPLLRKGLQICGPFILRTVGPRGNQRDPRMPLESWWIGRLERREIASIPIRQSASRVGSDSPRSEHSATGGRGRLSLGGFKSGIPSAVPGSAGSDLGDYKHQLPAPSLLIPHGRPTRTKQQPVVTGSLGLVRLADRCA